MRKLWSGMGTVISWLIEGGFGQIVFGFLAIACAYAALTEESTGMFVLLTAAFAYAAFSGP